MRYHITRLLSLFFLCGVVQLTAARGVATHTAGLTVTTVIHDGAAEEVLSTLVSTLAPSPDWVEEPTDDGVVEGSETVMLTAITIPDNNVAGTDVTLEFFLPDSYGHYTDLSECAEYDYDPDAYEDCLEESYDDGYEPDSDIFLSGRDIFLSESVGTTRSFPVRFRVTLKDVASSISETPVRISITDGTAGSADYLVTRVDELLMIPAGGTSAEGSMDINILQDDLEEGTENINVTASVPDLESTSQTISILDRNAESTGLVLVIFPRKLDEDAASNGISSARVAVLLNGAARDTQTSVTVEAMDGTTGSADYSVLSDASLVNINPGEFSVVGTVEIEIIDDDEIEGDETIVIEASASDLTGASGELTIIDNDDTGLSVTLSVSPSEVAEGAETATEVTVTATVDGGNGDTFAGMQTVTVSVGGPEDSATEGIDYAEVGDFDIIIPAGASSATGTFPLDPEGDDIAEDNETVSVAGLLGSRMVTPAVVTITDDDTESMDLLLTISPESVEEDADMVSLEVTASLDEGAAADDITVTIDVSDGTADSEDYSVGDIPSLIIPVGETSITGTVEIEITDDDRVEEDETIVIEISATDLTGASADLTIMDNDASITLGLSLDGLVEGVESAPEVMVMVTVNDEQTFVEEQTVTISVGAEGDSAEKGTDYTAVDDFEIMIPAGESSATGMFPFDPIDDDLVEGEETVSVTGLLGNVMVIPAEITINDDDVESTALALTIDDGDVRLNEDTGTGWVAFSAALNGVVRAMDTPVEISITADGTAVEDTDYSVSEVPTSLTIRAGETSIRDSLLIAIIDDDIMEDDETISLEISTSAMGLTSSVQNLVIIDDDSAVRIDTLMVDANDTGGYTITATVLQNMGAPIANVVLYYGDGIAPFEEVPMEMESESSYAAALMAPEEGSILYYYVQATNGDRITVTYPSEGRYWDVSNYTEGSRLVFLDFEDDDASDQSDVGHYVSYKGGEPTIAEGALVLDGVEDHAEILGSSLGASEEFALEIMFNANDFDAETLDSNDEYLVAKPVECDTCWEGSTFSLLWGRDDDSGPYVFARFGNSEYEDGQVELEIPFPLVADQWYHAMLEVQRKDGDRRAILQLRDGSGMLYGEDAAALPVLPEISTYPVFVGHIGDLGFFDGSIDNVAFYNYAHFNLSLTGVEGAEEVPEGYVLEQNYPNPFNPVTAIRYDLAAVGHVRLEVSDLLGRRVAVLVDEVQEAGEQEVRFDARDLPSGMYLYRLRIEDFVSVKKMVLLK